MKTCRQCLLNSGFMLGLGATLLFSVANAQTSGPEAAASTAEAAQAIAAELPADSPAVSPESTAADQSVASGPQSADAPVVPGADKSEPVGAASAEVVELVVVDSSLPAGAGADAAGAAPSEPVAADTIEVVSLPQVEKPVKPRYKKDDVLWIQQRLEELGYYTGPVDGAYGRVTREAIKAYQADQEIAQDGRPTSELRDFMWRNGG